MSAKEWLDFALYFYNNKIMEMLMPDELLTALACDPCLASFRLLVEVGPEVSVCDYGKEICPIFPCTMKRIQVGIHDTHGAARQLHCRP